MTASCPLRVSYLIARQRLGEDVPTHTKQKNCWMLGFPRGPCRIKYSICSGRKISNKFFPELVYFDTKSKPALGPPTLLSNGQHGILSLRQRGWRIKITAHLHLLSSLRVSAVWCTLWPSDEQRPSAAGARSILPNVAHTSRRNHDRRISADRISDATG
jgi:hypothetical protein